MGIFSMYVHHPLGFPLHFLWQKAVPLHTGTVFFHLFIWAYKKYVFDITFLTTASAFCPVYSSPVIQIFSKTSMPWDNLSQKKLSTSPWSLPFHFCMSEIILCGQLPYVPLSKFFCHSLIRLHLGTSLGTSIFFLLLTGW